METEMKQLPPVLKSLRSRRNLDAHHRYTSLRDVLLLHRCRPTFRSAIVGRHHASMLAYYGPRELDSSTICIRNQLVKRAASAYLHAATSAAYFAGGGRNQSSTVARMWRRLRQRRPSDWHACMSDPFEQCIGFVARSVSHALAYLVSHLGRVCAWGRTSICMS